MWLKPARLWTFVLVNANATLEIQISTVHYFKIVSKMIIEMIKEIAKKISDNSNWIQRNAIESLFTENSNSNFNISNDSYSFGP